MNLCQNEADVKFQMDILHLPHSDRGLQQLLLLISETSAQAVILFDITILHYYSGNHCSPVALMTVI